MGNSRQGPCNQIVDKSRLQLGINRVRNIGIKNLQEVTEPLPLGFFAKRFEPGDRFQIAIELVIERKRVQPQIDSPGSLFL